MDIYHRNVLQSGKRSCSWLMISEGRLSVSHATDETAEAVHGEALSRVFSVRVSVSGRSPGISSHCPDVLYYFAATGTQGFTSQGVG